MKDFFWALLQSIFILVCVIILFAVTIGKAAAAEPQIIQCNSGDASRDVECMRKEWRPKHQVSTMKATPYCYRDGGKLQGQGELFFWVDDEPYSYKIDCK